MKLSTYNVVEEVTPVALAAAVEIDASAFQSERVALVFTIATAAAGASAVLSAGGNYSDTSKGDMTIPVDDTGMFVCAVETARFLDSDNNFNIAITDIGALDGTVAVVQLP